MAPVSHLLVGMATQMPPVPHDRTIGEVFAELGTHVRELVTEEVALARTELRQKAAQVSAAGTRFGLAAALGYAGVLTLVASLVLAAIELFDVAPWLAALVVGATALAAAAGVYAGARRTLFCEPLAPRQTLASLKENAAWIRNHTR
jgi:hypothetical protein